MGDHRLPDSAQITELETVLTGIAEALQYPPTPDLVPGVVARVTAGQGHRDTWPWMLHFPRRRLPVIAAVCLLLAALGVGLVPASRTAVARWFGIGGVVITRGPLPPGPLGRSLLLGKRTTLDDARSQVTFPILVPALPSLGPPDEVYVGTVPGSRRVTLLYRARPGIPRAGTTGTGLLLTEFRVQPSQSFLRKLLSFNTTLKAVRIGQAPGYWISGQPHMLLYFSLNGTVFPDTVRLAGNTLLWSDGVTTLRLESALDEQAAVRVATSVR